jgi:hypothetical protein
MRPRTLSLSLSLPLSLFLTLTLLPAVGAPGTLLQAQTLQTPEQFFGHAMGADRLIARWDRMVEYYKALEPSGRIRVVDMGPSTLGNPFLALFISSPANLARLEELRGINARLADPRGVSESEIRQFVTQGKAVVIQSMSLHATEIGGSQMAVELVWDLVNREDEEARRIRDEVISILVPSFNPDGQIMVTDWYRENLGTEYEGVGYPSLYHKYTGHDNNRDAFMTNVVESQYMAKLMFRDWVPQAYVDHHHMGSYGARLYVPPYAEPVRPFADPLVWREMSWYGGHIAYKEEEQGLSGIINAAIYSGWGHFGFHWITPFHNIAGMLTESASARLATPLFIHPDQLRGNTRGLPEYEEQTTFPNPWPGGWWRLRDIVLRQKVSAWATLDIAARNRETVLWNAYLKAKRQTDRGAAGETKAYIIPAQQHDPLTATKMVNKLLVQGIEVQGAPQGFTHEGRVYGPGTFVVSMAQPKMGVIRWLLGRTFYPDNSYTRDAEGNPIRPYDMSTDNMAEFMGVRVDPVASPVRASLTKITAEIAAAGGVSRGSHGYVIDGRQNDAFRAVNSLLDRRVAVRRVDRAGTSGLLPGDFIVPAAPDAVVADVARQTGVDFAALNTDVAIGSHAVSRQRIGMVQRYYGGNMDEGWTRLLLEQFGFPYATLMDAELKAGNLSAKYDVILLPADGLTSMTGERGQGGGRGGAPDAYPPKYRSGFGAEGVNALQAFVRAGGTLLTFAEAASLPIERFGLPLRDVTANRPSREFWSPGSTLHLDVDNTNPLAYGMPGEGLATFLQGNQAWEIVTTDRNERVHVVAKYPDRDLLQSGWLLGEDVIAKKAAVVSVEHGQGRVVMIGFRAQHRAQTHGTFKFVFNALLGGAAPAAADGGR